jgi:hypothetical protein
MRYFNGFEVDFFAVPDVVEKRGSDLWTLLLSPYSRNYKF